MSAPTPVMTRHMTAASASKLNSMSARKLPTGIQLNSTAMPWRRLTGRRCTDHVHASVVMKERPIIPVASSPPNGSFRRRPSTSSTAAPKNGKAGMRNMASFKWTSLIPSSPQQRDVVGRRGAPAPEDGDQDGQADDDLGGGHHHDEEDSDLAGAVVELAAVADQRQVDGVEHDLDAHEHDQRVAPDEEADHADGEQRGGQHLVRGG